MNNWDTRELGIGILRIFEEAQRFSHDLADKSGIGLHTGSGRKRWGRESFAKNKATKAKAHIRAVQDAAVERLIEERIARAEKKQARHV